MTNFYQKIVKFFKFNLAFFFHKVGKFCEQSIFRIFVKIVKVCLHSIWRTLTRNSESLFINYIQFDEFLSKIVCLFRFSLTTWIFFFFFLTIFFRLSRMICSIIANIQKTWIANWNPWHVQILDVSIQRLNK